MKSPINKQTAMQVTGIAVGYFGGNALQNTIGQKISNDKIRALATIFIGAIVAKKGGKGFISNAGTGIAVSGAIKLIGSVMPESVKTMIAGDDDYMMGEIAEQIAGDTVLNGTNSYQDIAGLSVLNGTDEFGDNPNT